GLTWVTVTRDTAAGGICACPIDGAPAITPTTTMPSRVAIVLMAHPSSKTDVAHWPTFPILAVESRRHSNTRCAPFKAEFFVVSITLRRARDVAMSRSATRAIPFCPEIRSSDPDLPQPVESQWLGPPQ